MKTVVIAILIAASFGCSDKSTDTKPVDTVVVAPAPTPVPPAPVEPPPTVKPPEPVKLCTWQDDGTDDFGPCNPAPKPQGNCECGKKQGGYREVTNGTPSSCVIWKCL